MKPVTAISEFRSTDRSIRSSANSAVPIGLVDWECRDIFHAEQLGGANAARAGNCLSFASIKTALTQGSAPPATFGHRGFRRSRLKRGAEGHAELIQRLCRAGFDNADGGFGCGRQ